MLLHSVRHQPIICQKAAPYVLLVSDLRRKYYGVTSGNQPFVNLRSAHLFLRYAYRSGTISAPLSARLSKSRISQAPISIHIGVVLASRLFTPFKGQQTESPQNPYFHISISLSAPSLLLGVSISEILFWSFVILTIAVIYLYLLSFIVTYRLLFKMCSNSIISRFQGILAHKKFVRFASRQMAFECAILFIAVKILGQQKGKKSLTFTAA